MDTSLKEKVHALVDSSNEEMLEAVFQLLSESEYTDDFKSILNEEQADYYKNKEVISQETLDRLVKEVLKK